VACTSSFKRCSRIHYNILYIPQLPIIIIFDLNHHKNIKNPLYDKKKINICFGYEVKEYNLDNFFS